MLALARHRARVAKAIDATRIAGKLYQGSFPAPGPALYRAGFDILVLTARELQPEGAFWPGVAVWHAPLRDDGSAMSVEEWTIARRTAASLADVLRRGAKCLVSCARGRNRSGFVVALTLHILGDCKGLGCVTKVRARRDRDLAPGDRPAIVNESFLAVLGSI